MPTLHAIILNRGQSSQRRWWSRPRQDASQVVPCILQLYEHLCNFLCAIGRQCVFPCCGCCSVRRSVSFVVRDAKGLVLFWSGCWAGVWHGFAAFKFIILSYEGCGSWYPTARSKLLRGPDRSSERFSCSLWCSHDFKNHMIYKYTRPDLSLDQMKPRLALLLPTLK